ncbi:MAG: CinA family protein [Bdellovibrionaceae bacterium]|nr:CinA family protein [Pseudobdellovibrionaceae bacterium]
MSFPNETAILQLTASLRDRRYTVGFGESCTGGLLSARMAALAGVSDVFMGSVVSYSYAAKVDLLGVKWETLNEQGAVSEQVALEMARGVCEKLKANCAIAVTGIAGPSGGTPEKPVGTVWIAVKGPRFEVAEKFVFSGDRLEIQSQSTTSALALLQKNLV